jgi:hypothetical protein
MLQDRKATSRLLPDMKAAGLRWPCNAMVLDAIFCELAERALRTRAGVGLCVALTQALALAGLSQAAMAQDGGYRWQTVTSRERSSLVLARPTDFVTGRFEFSCVRGSGTVVVSVSMKDQQRARFADLLKSKDDPEITLAGGDVSNGLTIEALKFSRHGGWMYGFRVDDDSKWMADFESTGTVRLSVGKTIKDEEGLNAGLEAIGEFRKQCRKGPLPSESSLPWTRPNPNAFPPPNLAPVPPK